MNKVFSDARTALAGLLHDGMVIMAGGFGLCGIPETLIHAIRDSGVKHLTVVSNNAGIDGEKYVMERGLVADLSIVHAWKADTEGNLVYRKTARNFNPMMATAGKVTVAEVEILVDPGTIEPDHIVTPGIYVQRIVPGLNAPKHIEQRTTRPRP